DEMLPSMLAAGAFDRAATMLDELAQILATADTLTGPVRERVQHVFEQLADPDVLRQLVQMMDEAPHTPQGESLERLLGHFPGQSLAPLTGMIESVMRPDVRRLLETAATRLAAANRQEVVRLLADPDPGVVRGALQGGGDLAIGGAAADVLRLLRHAEPPIRVAAIGAAVRLRAAIAGPTLIGLLDDPEREVRIAAAKAVGSLADEAARPTLEGAIQGKRLRAADRSEKIAFFEALGRVG